jgi:radical SAM superfamily enzyme YgiQ (UPF0313 family)
VSVRVLLISTYDLGRQPLGLAAPTAWLRSAGIDVRAVDTSREPLLDEDISAAGLVAFFLPMHTATRLAVPLVDRVKAVNPDARLAAYGLYAPLNAEWLRERGVDDVLGPDAEHELVSLARFQGSRLKAQGSSDEHSSRRNSKEFIQPDRSSLPPLTQYAALQMPDGTRRVVGNTDATRGCKHVCRHCPIVPVYQGRFHAVPLDIVFDDIRAQVAQGAQHITFGDPDFFNGPTHARRLVERLAREFPHITYDVIIKIEHLLKHCDMLSLLRETGCLFITSAVESVDDAVLEKLQKGHTRADFIRAVDLCRRAGVALAPTFVAFTPWTTLESYANLLDQIDTLDLVNDVAPIQLAIRLLVTAESRLLELPDVRALVEPFDPQSLTWPWRHADPRVDELQRNVMGIVSARSNASRGEIFEAIKGPAKAEAINGPAKAGHYVRPIPPFVTEAWYCCAEPMDHLGI